MSYNRGLKRNSSVLFTGSTLVSAFDDRFRHLEQRLDMWGERIQKQLQQQPATVVVARGFDSEGGVAFDGSAVKIEAPFGSDVAHMHSVASKRMFEDTSDGSRPRVLATRSIPYLVATNASTAAAAAVAVGGSAVGQQNTGRKLLPALQGEEEKASDTARPSSVGRGSVTTNAEVGGFGRLSRAGRSYRDLQMEGYRTRYNTMIGKSLRGDDARMPNPAERLVSMTTFDYAIGVLIFYNTLTLGAEVQTKATHEGETGIQFFDVSELICITLFTMELCLRIFAFKSRFCMAVGFGWAALDIFLVTMGLTDLMLRLGGASTEGGSGALASAGSSAGKVLKIIRMVRIVRMIRMIRFLAELRVMLQMVVNSLLSLIWLLVFLVMVLYGFGILLTEGVTDFISEGQESEEGLLEDYYGDLFITMYSLFLSMTGGINWGEIAMPLLQVGNFYFVMVIAFICFTTFSVLNIVTGVFVDGAIELASQDRSILLEKEKQARDAAAGHLLDLLEKIDHDASGTISRSEFMSAMQRPDVVTFMEALHIDTSEAFRLYDLLDVDQDDLIDVADWVEGMRRLKGEARSIDLHQLRMEMRTMIHGLARKMGLEETSLLSECRLTSKDRGSSNRSRRGSSDYRKTVESKDFYNDSKEGSGYRSPTAGSFPDTDQNYYNNSGDEERAPSNSNSRSNSNSQSRHPSPGSSPDAASASRRQAEATGITHIGDGLRLLQTTAGNKRTI